MSTIKRTLAQALSSIFPKSEKVIAESLSVEDHNVFTAELKAETERADQLQVDLATANQQIASLTEQIAEERQGQATLQAALSATETERDKYKAHYEAAVKTGVVTPGEDMNSREPEAVAGYNQHALEIFKRHHD